jgi:hypothetical protein
MLAEELGVGHMTVQRVWKEHGLKPHLSRPFKLSNDPKFAEKVVDIVGLYLDPPAFDAWQAERCSRRIQGWGQAIANRPAVRLVPRRLAERAGERCDKVSAGP